MRLVIFVIALLIILEGVALVLRPQFYRHLLRFFAKGRLVYVAGFLKIILGVVFFIAALNCSHKWIIILFGILLLFGGMLLVLIKIDRIKAMLIWWEQRPDISFRILGIAAIIIGVIVAYATGMPIAVQ